MRGEEAVSISTYIAQQNPQAKNPFLSVLIPSRGRVSDLIRSMASIRATCERKDVDIWVRLDSDDYESLDRLSSIREEAHIVLGQRLGGYYSLNVFYTELANLTSAPLIWLFNDDCVIIGDWMDDLRRLRSEALCKYEPGIFQVGESKYPLHAPSTCPIVPNGCWKQFGMETIPAVTDVHLHELLTNHGYATVFLQKLHLIHKRYPDETYQQHRRLL